MSSPDDFLGEFSRNYDLKAPVGELTGRALDALAKDERIRFQGDDAKLEELARVRLWCALHDLEDRDNTHWPSVRKDVSRLAKRVRRLSDGLSRDFVKTPDGVHGLDDLRMFPSWNLPGIEEGLRALESAAQHFERAAESSAPGCGAIPNRSLWYAVSELLRGVAAVEDDAELAGLVLSSEHDWVEEPCPAFRLRYARDRAVDVEGAARERLIGQIRQMRTRHGRRAKQGS